MKDRRLKENSSLRNTFEVLWEIYDEGAQRNQTVSEGLGLLGVNDRESLAAEAALKKILPAFTFHKAASTFESQRFDVNRIIAQYPALYKFATQLRNIDGCPRDKSGFDQMLRKQLAAKVLVDHEILNAA